MSKYADTYAEIDDVLYNLKKLIRAIDDAWQDVESKELNERFGFLAEALSSAEDEADSILNYIDEMDEVYE